MSEPIEAVLRRLRMIERSPFNWKHAYIAKTCGDAADLILKLTPRRGESVESDEPPRQFIESMGRILKR